MRRRDVDIGRLVNYALRLDVGAVVRRLGFLLEVCGIDAPADRERLRARLTATYHLLDPTLPPEGRRLARWRIRLNVIPEEDREPSEHKRCYFGDYRFSEDLDFTLTEEVPFETIRAKLEPVFEGVFRPLQRTFVRLG